MPAWIKLPKLFERWRRRQAPVPRKEHRSEAPNPMQRVAAQRKAIVKDRPASLMDRYELVSLDELTDEVFLRLRQKVYGALDKASVATGHPSHYRDAGRLAPSRPYFYIQPLNHPGLLFERAGAGWVVSSAQKIAAHDTFLRSEAPIERVSLFVPRNGEGLPRVQSTAEKGTLMALAVYEQRLLQRLGLETP